MPDDQQRFLAEDALGVIVLAAGAGTRMRSELPKPLHRVAGAPMVEHVVRTVESLGTDRIVIVGSPALAAGLPFDQFGCQVAEQPVPSGTGDAARIGLEALDGLRYALVVYADHPLLVADDVRVLVDAARSAEALVGVMTCTVDDAAGYGRIERDEDERITGVVELVDDDTAMRSGSVEINSGVMILDVVWARETLRTLPENPIKHEVFLTDLVSAASRAGGSSAVVSVAGDKGALIGVNDRVELATVDTLMRRRIREIHMRNGVTILGPESVFIDIDVAIGEDTSILPNTSIGRGSTVGANCVIGPGTVVESSEIADGAVIEQSVIRGSRIGEQTHVGPFSHLRGGSHVDSGVHIGNFVEIKNSSLARGVRAGHMSYLGDATIGEGTNIGAGTVTCNFDGVAKHRTTIGANVFVGSDSMLVAPLEIGDGAVTGAGSVVTKDVEPGARVVGIPARPMRPGKRARAEQAAEPDREA
jgi:bifunctional UDP-N-acetylglucosamine pyrophosphorylase / glucosamine-1-phosphate N-acetyltransferase